MSDNLSKLASEFFKRKTTKLLGNWDSVKTIKLEVNGKTIYEYEAFNYIIKK